MPSLTLTDPDMILPYDGSERESQTPSPPSTLVYLTNLNARYNAADPHAGSARPKKNFSRHRTHDEMNASRRLSDIGEEMSPAWADGFDEVVDPQDQQGPQQEEEQQQQQQQRRLGLRGSPLQRTHSPAIGNQESANVELSSSSSSTVSGRSSGEASSPQSAPEVSPNAHVVESGSKTGSGDEVKIGSELPDSSIVTSAVKGKGPGEEFSSAILSSEAERILENAKKRLTVCGDLAWQTMDAALEHSRGKLTCFAVDGGQFESRSLFGASYAFAFAVRAGQYLAHGPAPRWIVSVDFQGRSQGLDFASPVIHLIARCLEQSPFSRAQRDQFPG
jgi:hypothetical protein